MRKTFLFSLLLIVCLNQYALYALCEEQTADGTQDVPVSDKEKEKLANLLPDAQGLGLQPQGERQYYGSDLYMYIDGAAPAYHAYDFAALIVQEYKKGDAILTVEIYDMDKRLNAFGIYSAERSPKNNFLEIGAESYGDDSALNFYQGSYYVKLQASSPKEKTGPLLLAAAEQISQQIKKGKKLPKELKLFPADGLIPHSQQYMNKAPLGHDALAPAFQALYENGEKECQLVLSIAETPQQAQERIAKLKSHFEKTGKIAPQPAIGAEAFRGENEYEGALIAFPCERYAIIAVNPPQDAAAFAQKIVESIIQPKKDKEEKKDNPEKTE
ncbi:MAG: DUF6599 family protein [Candidatus Omnitrophota bacterium]